MKFHSAQTAASLLSSSMCSSATMPLSHVKPWADRPAVVDKIAYTRSRYQSIHPHAGEIQ